MATHKSAGVPIMKKLLAGFTVLVVHTAAAHAQQVAPQPQELPPAYAPPPGYIPPPAPPVYGPPPAYNSPPPPRAYAPPAYGPPPYPQYRYAPYRYAPPPQPYYTYPPAQPQRDALDRPFTLGGGIGFGGVIFNDQYSTPPQQRTANGFSYTFRLGFGLRPGLLLLWDVEGAVANSGTSTVSQTANLVALQIFATQRLFIKGGFGIADAVPGVNLATEWGAAAMGGIGYELIQGWNWSFDIEATITGARLNNNGLDQTWTNWSLVNFALNFY
jgi:hypothetical protein